MDRRRTGVRRPTPPPAEGLRSCPRAPGLAAQLRRARPPPSTSRPPPPQRRSRRSRLGRAAFRARSCEAGERSAHFCLLRTFSCLIRLPAQAAQGADEQICCPATLLGRLRDVKEETCFASPLATSGTRSKCSHSPEFAHLELKPTGRFSLLLFMLSAMSSSIQGQCHNKKRDLELASPFA